MYLVAICEACGGGADYMFLNNIIQYASADLRIVLMAKADGTRSNFLQHAEELAHFAQAWEQEPAKDKMLRQEVVNIVSERRRETQRCHECGEIGHLRASCPERQTGKGRKPEATLSVGETSDESEDEWILNSGSSRHFVKDASWLEDVEPCNGRWVQLNGEPLIVTKKGAVTLLVSACGVEQTDRLTDVYYARNVVHNLISYGQLDKKGYVLTQKSGRRVVAARDGGKVAFDVELRRHVLTVSGKLEKRLRPPSEVIMAALEEEAAGPDGVEGTVLKGTLMAFHLRLGHLNYDAVERLARDPSFDITLTDYRRVNCLTCAQGK